jgi:head-tail adaptor
MALTSGDLKQRIIVSRLTKTADGYGGWTSTTAVIGTYWCRVLETSGDISAKNGIRSLETQIEIMIRRPTADLIQNQDILQVEGNASTYRINSGYQTIENFWVKITATKIEG